MKQPNVIHWENGESPYSATGVDLTQVRWMLSLTPMQRLEALQSAMQSLWSILHVNAAKARLPGDAGSPREPRG